MRACIEKIEELLHSFIGLMLAVYFKNRTVNILDLDNTLAPTRLFQLEKGRIDVFADESFPSFPPGAKKFCAYCATSAPTIILTARPYKSIISTVNYLKRETDFRIFFICRTASLKLTYLYQLNKYCMKVNYYDDLSHGTTEIKLYDEIIEKVIGFERIHYYGIEYINKYILCD